MNENNEFYTYPYRYYKPYITVCGNSLFAYVCVEDEKENFYFNPFTIHTSPPEFYFKRFGPYLLHDESAEAKMYSDVLTDIKHRDIQFPILADDETWQDIGSQQEKVVDYNPKMAVEFPINLNLKTLRSVDVAKFAPRTMLGGKVHHAMSKKVIAAIAAGQIINNGDTQIVFWKRGE